MNFKPILFSTPMVQAILNGTKVQTRRVVKGTTLDWLNKEFIMDLSLCPYGEVGDVLWVRETFAKIKSLETGLTYILPKADHEHYKEKIIQGSTIKWKPAIHMPKEACRLFLKIKDIRVERLQDISRGDAMAEGCPFPNIAKETFPTVWFEELWCKINGEQSWNENPWVWVIEFERIEKPENF